MNFVGFIAPVTLAIAIAGCATVPMDAEPFSKTAVPIPASDEVVLVVFRQVTPPTMGSLAVQINGASKADLPNNSYTLIKTKAGPTGINVSYPAISMIEPIKVQTSFEGGSTHYLEIVGGVGPISMPGPLVQVWKNLAERNAEDAVRVLTQCCRRIIASQL